MAARASKFFVGLKDKSFGDERLFITVGARKVVGNEWILKVHIGDRGFAHNKTYYTLWLPIGFNLGSYGEWHFFTIGSAKYKLVCAHADGAKLALAIYSTIEWCHTCYGREL